MRTLPPLLAAVLLLSGPAAANGPASVTDPPGDAEPLAAATWGDLLGVSLVPLDRGAWQAQIHLSALARAPPGTWHLLLFEDRGASFYAGAFWEVERVHLRAGRWDPVRLVPLSGEAMEGLVDLGAPGRIHLNLSAGFPRSPLLHGSLQGLVLDDTARALDPDNPPWQVDETGASEPEALSQGARLVPGAPLLWAAGLVALVPRGGFSRCRSRQR